MNPNIILVIGRYLIALNNVPNYNAFCLTLLLSCLTAINYVIGSVVGVIKQKFYVMQIIFYHHLIKCTMILTQNTVKKQYYVGFGLFIKL